MNRVVVVGHQVPAIDAVDRQVVDTNISVGKEGNLLSALMRSTSTASGHWSKVSCIDVLHRDDLHVVLYYDVLHLILGHLGLSALDLSRAGGCCLEWRNITQDIARQLTFATCARPIRMLYASQELRSRVGPRPDRKTVHDEWPSLRINQIFMLAKCKGAPNVVRFIEWLARTGGAPMVLDYFSSKKEGGIAMDATKNYNEGIEWQVQHGWEREDATTTSLLVKRCYNVICHLYQQPPLQEQPQRRTSTFPVSCFAVHDSLWARSLLPEATVVGASGRSVAPKCYKEMGGEFGFGTHDESVWDALKSEVVGTRVRARSFPCGHAASKLLFPNAAGISRPVVTDGGMTNIIVDSDIICFSSSPSADAQVCRTLVQVDNTRWRLPAFALITLEKVHQAGTWRALEGGSLINQRCFEVSIEY